MEEKIKEVPIIDRGARKFIDKHERLIMENEADIRHLERYQQTMQTMYEKALMDMQKEFSDEIQNLKHMLKQHVNSTMHPR